MLSDAGECGQYAGMSLMLLDTRRVLENTFVAAVECHATITSTNDRGKEPRRAA